MSNSKDEKTIPENVIYANFGLKRRVDSLSETLVPEPLPPSLPDADTDNDPDPDANNDNEWVFEIEYLEEELPQDPEFYTGEWLSTVTMSQMDKGRLYRGLSGYNDGNLIVLNFQNSTIRGQIKGSGTAVYDVTIALPYRSTDELSATLQEFLADPAVDITSENIIIPDKYLNVLQASLDSLPLFICSCPDQADVCKHCLTLALGADEELAKNRRQIFEMRGLNLSQVEESLEKQKLKAAATKLSTLEGRFWEGSELPALPNPEPFNVVEHSDMEYLYKAMEAVSYTSRDLLIAMTDLEDIYYQLCETTD
ncbi:hypothetical protein [Corynebacterium caspium]|uniref:hypothetical protein n=1 Tax=Corynebacterium caspium TaxID=234828 RepID=UPI00037E6006|nr:hypothetical protein [Corynebacterium caspium]WKD59484.1 hypothetical protein CCASP_05485 [Corynebacterium caspium DSM 44850]